MNVRTGVQHHRGTVGTGTVWGRQGAATHERQGGAATMDLQFRLCSLIYEWKRKGGDVECSVNLACELLV